MHCMFFFFHLNMLNYYFYFPTQYLESNITTAQVLSNHQEKKKETHSQTDANIK